MELGEAARQSLEMIVSRLREETVRMNVMTDSRFLRAESAHLTLVFLGETAENRLPALCSALEKAAQVAPFEFMLSGLGAFPSASRARVLWAGVGAGSERLGSLAGAMRRALAGLIQLEEREYVPHITVCRFRRPENINKLEVYRALQETEIGKCLVNRFLLMKSILEPAGAVHEPVRLFDLGAPAS